MNKSQVVAKLRALLAQAEALNEAVEDKASEVESDAAVERWESIAAAVAEARAAIETAVEEIEGIE